MKNYFAILRIDTPDIDKLIKDEWNEELKEKYDFLTIKINKTKIINSGTLQNIGEDEVNDYINILQAEINEAYDILSDKNKRDNYLCMIGTSANNAQFEESEIEKFIRLILKNQE